MRYDWDCRKRWGRGSVPPPGLAPQARYPCAPPPFWLPFTPVRHMLPWKMLPPILAGARLQFWNSLMDSDGKSIGGHYEKYRKSLEKTLFDREVLLPVYVCWNILGHSFPRMRLDTSSKALLAVDGRLLGQGLGHLFCCYSRISFWVWGLWKDKYRKL